MGIVKTAIEHDGETYAGEIATIRSSFFGTEYHGIVSASLNLEWKGGGVSAGGYCLDEPRDDDKGKHVGRFGTAYGLDHLMRIMETVGVEQWESLPGKQVIALFTDGGGLGSMVVGIAGLTNEKVLIFKDHANKFLNDEKDN